MEIQLTGVLISRYKDFRDTIEYSVFGGEFGENDIQVDSLDPDTDYYAKGIFVIDGVEYESENITMFHTGKADAFPLKIKNAHSGQNTITIEKQYGSTNDISLEYSTDLGETWSTWNSPDGDFSVTLDVGGEVWLKGENTTINTDGPALGDYHFGSDEIFDCEGNISSILKKDMSVLQRCALSYLFMNSKVRKAPDMPNYIGLGDLCFIFMFYGCTSLTQAPDLPATTLAEGCYYGMFSGCTSLTQAPDLPATTLAEECYHTMFSGCTSLTQAPALPATTLADLCYTHMFRNCTSLTQAPALPATTLTISCYNGMFGHCTSLTQAPDLPATTLAEGCYAEMFSVCTSLTQAPDLPATTLISTCYRDMFIGCTSLTQAPEIHISPDHFNCYKNMFNGCTSLSKIICYTTSWNTDYTEDWVYNVSTRGDFYNLGGATIPRGTNGIPTNWTVHTSL